MEDSVQVRVFPAARGPTLIYLPGLHGDWTLIGTFRKTLGSRATFVDMTYPRSVSWSLTEYARAVDQALGRAGLESGWLLAESFGSQVAWALLADREVRLQVRGLVLAGGFVRYGQRWLLHAGERILQGVRAESLQRPLRAWGSVVRWLRYRNAMSEEELAAFLERRTEADKLAAAHRLRLIAEADWRAVASATTRPVYGLAALVDPVVLWWPVRRWLRRHCPGYRGSRVIGPSDHNVLGSAPQACADQILKWIAAAEG